MLARFLRFRASIHTMSRRAFALYIILALLQTMFAQQVFMKKIDHPNGIQAHDIYSVFEDSDHYLWFTTDGGIWRFDGKNYRNFTSENGLPDNVVFLFCEDKKKRKWFETYSSKIAFIEGDSIHELACNNYLSQLKKMEIPAGIYVDSTETVYITYFRSDDYLKIAPPYKKENVSAIDIRSKNEFYVITPERGNILCGSLKDIAKGNERQMTFINSAAPSIKILPNSTREGHRVSASKQFDNSFLISGDNALIEYKDGKLKTLTLLDYTILSGLKDIYGNYWISTIDGGLFFYSKKDTAFTHPGVYLKGKSVGRIIQDHEGAYWITTLNEGVYYIPHIDLLLSNSGNGYNDNITFVAIDTFQKTLFCIDSKGYLFIRKGDHTTRSIYCGEPEKINLIKCLIPRGNNNYLFLGRYSFLLNSNSMSIQPAKYLEGIQSCGFNNKATWIARQSHLMTLNAKKLTFENEKEFKAKINSIYPVNDSILWLGTERGLVNYNYTTEKAQTIPENIEAKSIISILRIKPGRNLIVYKSDGLFIVDDKLRLIKKLLIDIKGYSIKHALKDVYNNIWISTNKGILRIDQGLNVENINEQNGLPSNIINNITTDGTTAYAASDNGLIEFPIVKSFINKVPPDIFLNTVSINNRENSTDTLFDLSYDQNFIKVSFTAISYRSNNDVLCYYKMEGIDDKWKNTRNSEIEYTTLPPGTYTLSIYALSKDGIVSNKKINITFNISAPFWKTWWFILLISASLILVISVFFSWRLAIVRRRSKEKAELHEQLSQMEMQALRSQMNPHFIFNAINSIQHYILSNETLLANKFLVKFSKLVRNVLEQSKQELIPLKEEIETLKFYIEIESIRFEDSFGYAINIDGSLDQLKTRVPPLILQPFVENAIWHGLLLRNGKKELVINIGQEDAFLVIKIDDNGIGRDASKVFANKDQKKRSLGIEITKNRLDLLSRSTGLNIHVKIIDKFHEGGAAGTTVLIKIPLFYRK